MKLPLAFAIDKARAARRRFSAIVQHPAFFPIAAALILLLPVIGILLPNPTLPEGGEALVLVEIPSVADFLQDTAVVRYLVEAGVGGVVVRPSTLGGILAGPDVSMAAGGEILRHFRMEGIANIWIGEQLRGRPLRGDAIYIFTNQFILFESILTTLRGAFGERAARPYNDGEHDFGGGVPGNFIIEAFVPQEEIRAAAFGLERNLRERLATYGLRPVIELSGAEPPEADESATYLVTTDIAAQAAWRVLPGERVLLLAGVKNPGWRQVTPARRGATDTAIHFDGAIVTPLADSIRLLSELQARGIALGRSPAGAAGADDEHAAAVRFIARLRRLTLLFALVGIGFVLARGVVRPPFVLCADIAVLVGGLAALFLVWHAETAAAALAVAGGVFAACAWERLGAARRLWLFAAIALILLQAGTLIAVGRELPHPWSLSLVAIALVAGIEFKKGLSNGIFLPIVALLASGFVPWSAWPMAGVMLPALILPDFLRAAELRAALRATFWPAGLLLLSHGALDFGERLGLAILFWGVIAALTCRRQMLRLIDLYIFKTNA